MVQAGYDYNSSYYPQEATASAPQKPKTSRKVRRLNKDARNFFIKLGLLFFVYGMVLVYLSIQGSVLGYQVVGLEKEIEKLQISNARLEHDIAQVSSLDNIEKRAVQELGMVKPDLAAAVSIPVLSSSQDKKTVADNQPAENPDKPLEKVYYALRSLADVIR